MTQQENLIDWLRDAHAMEKQAETMLKAQSSRIENYPEVKARIDQHLTETQSQASRLEECLGALGTSPSGMKDAGGKMTAMMQGLGGSMTSDEIVKGALASYAFEHFEIAAYTALAAAAEQLGESRIAGICNDILQEEKAMASFLQDHLPGVTKTYLERQASGLNAKR